MKTTTTEVLCNGCGASIPTLSVRAIFATLKGPTIRHKKLDLCDINCLRIWATFRVDDPKQGGNAP